MDEGENRREHWLLTDSARNDRGSVGDLLIDKCNHIIQLNYCHQAADVTLKVAQLHLPTYGSTSNGVRLDVACLFLPAENVRCAVSPSSTIGTWLTDIVGLNECLHDPILLGILGTNA